MYIDRESAKRFSVDATAATHFAWLRTRLSIERTLMSVNRTSISLIGFGFTIYQFLAKLKVTQGVAPARFESSPQSLGLILIGTGLLLLILGTIEYRSFINYLHNEPFDAVAGEVRRRWHTGTLVTTALIFVAGLFAFVAVLFRV